ncbi:8-oxoguanine DNA glycosylase OGG fold protein [Streptomyces sp. NPDC003480]
MGKGQGGSPGGSGPTTLRRILAADSLEAALAGAVTAMSEHSATAAYAALRGRVPGLGPSFFTKFLYFTGKAVPPANGPQPLILDRVLARRMRSLAVACRRSRPFPSPASKRSPRPLSPRRRRGRRRPAR